MTESIVATLRYKVFGYTDELVLTSNTLTQKWEDGRSAGQQTYRLNTLMPDVSFRTDYPEHFYMFRKYSMALGVMLIVMVLLYQHFGSRLLGGGQLVADIVGYAVAVVPLALAWCVFRLFRYWYKDMWTMIQKDDGSVITYISHKFADQGKRESFERAYNRAVLAQKE